MAVDTDAISQALSGGVSEVTAALEQMVIGPAVRGFLSVALFTIIFAALGIFVLPADFGGSFCVPVRRFCPPIDPLFGRCDGILAGVAQSVPDLRCAQAGVLFYREHEVLQSGNYHGHADFEQILCV